MMDARQTGRFIMDDLKFTIGAIIFLIVSLFVMMKLMATLTS